ncbi:MAG TPA: helix-turn-helix transcriptional regulator [Blastocatellia bacterium]|nr:helix-turn-helix transcriptional regulator [Blastocatellia bacterium]
MVMKRKAKGYTISAVADHYGVHQQTLRMYEREGLLKPSRSDGNVRLYSDEDLVRLELILNLTRDLGVNLAGVEIILNMREKMDQMQSEFNRFFQLLRDYMANQTAIEHDPQATQALVPTRRTVVVRTSNRRNIKIEETEE